ncbi:endonuclease/exonuclease/phosphatase family protein [Bailinhaonella thermotolerans]|uniref:Endonuclease/exonuclease/phosphatase n=1 Tax=Bailinhaonella thermotolerans TaxID=1070861 RepID=A0A3A4B048_9ACTN|nr:endonuclease/exonuclease/phosphatase family protein [Bailinhaonella thermotolerans]RJL31407.1 endonuclease/exonuclease/phosphatase [Bailinhaonella thermotolerans]
MTLIRIASYNVRGLRDDRSALLRVIRGLGADVLCLQEVPRLAFWRRRRALLAESAGLRPAAGVRVGGVAVAVSPRVRVLADASAPLRGFARLERRALALAAVEVDGERLVVGSVHLDLHGGARLAHAAEIAGRVAALRRAHGARAVLAGDLNEGPDGPVWRYLGRGYADAGAACGNLTFPARGPRARIDGILVGEGLRVVSCGVARADPGDLRAASDHLPVVAEVEPDQGSAPSGPEIPVRFSH